MRNNCHCNFYLNISEIPPLKIKPLMLEKEERKAALERRDVRQKMAVVNVPPTTPCRLSMP